MMTESEHLPRIEIEYNPQDDFYQRWSATYWYLFTAERGISYPASFTRYGYSRKVALGRVQRELDTWAAAEAAKKNKEIIEL